MIPLAKQEYPDKYELLLTIPGIGEITAIAVLAEIGDASDFLNARQLAAFIGVTPKHRDSGASVRVQTRISKIGNNNIRKALYLPATSIRCSPYVKKWAEKLKARGKKGKQIVVAVMRKLIHIIYGILKNNKEFSEKVLLKPELCA